MNVKNQGCPHYEFRPLESRTFSNYKLADEQKKFNYMAASTRKIRGVDIQKTFSSLEEQVERARDFFAQIRVG